ncbi:hypothetical protein BKE38_08680 [Pseudoroseomonas deserti]|uniref:Resolvase/invertase-type recombinase catalytic domain-containing protein n=2 Tax=Teichococcus deserti TaxID=1817963 RepID=A0A1V2H4W1_9PROT|nr:hypothetical protein BKE38_08680 [Pseudoroseomonas deserti]
MTVYGYTRVSTQQQVAEGESLEVQQRQVRGYCMMQGLEDPEVFTEAGVSGSVPLASRPQGRVLSGLLRKGDVVVAAKLDRMFRDAADALNTIKLFKKQGISLDVIDFGGDVINNPNAKMMMQLLAVFAESERDRISERVSTTKADQRARGKYLGGKVPFGFAVDAEGLLVRDDEQQQIVAHVLDLKAQGISYRKTICSVQQKFAYSIALNTVMKICNAN